MCREVFCTAAASPWLQVYKSTTRQRGIPSWALYLARTLLHSEKQAWKFKIRSHLSPTSSASNHKSLPSRNSVHAEFRWSYCRNSSHRGWARHVLCTPHSAVFLRPYGKRWIAVHAVTMPTSPLRQAAQVTNIARLHFVKALFNTKTAVALPLPIYIVNMYIYIWLYIYIYDCIYIYMTVYMTVYIYTYTCMCVCLYIYIIQTVYHIYIYIIHDNTCIYMLLSSSSFYRLALSTAKLGQIHTNSKLMPRTSSLCCLPWQVEKILWKQQLKEV